MTKPLIAGYWLEEGECASRPPGEIHGPFRAEEECIVFEVSYPSEAKIKGEREK